MVLLLTYIALPLRAQVVELAKEATIVKEEIRDDMFAIELRVNTNEQSFIRIEEKIDEIREILKEL